VSTVDVASTPGTLFVTSAAVVEEGLADGVIKVTLERGSLRSGRRDPVHIKEGRLYCAGRTIASAYRCGVLSPKLKTITSPLMSNWRNRSTGSTARV
jgi:hypothetical protein